MPTLFEIATWSEDDTRAEIHKLLPDGWTFDFQADDGFWVATFRDKEGAIVWEGDNPASNMLLFDAYGWLWLRLNPQRRTNVWTPRPGRKDEVPRPKSIDVEDPADLDPEQIAAVYADRERQT